MNNIIKPQLMLIKEVNHYDNNENVIWSEKNLPNIWHDEGQEFILFIAFDIDEGVEVPSQYYLGLDNRTTLSGSDDLDSLIGEPTTNGYARQSLSSSNGFTISPTTTTAVSGIKTFVASVGSWGPVKNVFLATTLDNTGRLISSVSLGGERTILAGESIAIRINLSLSGCG